MLYPVSVQFFSNLCFRSRFSFCKSSNPKPKMLSLMAAETVGFLCQGVVLLWKRSVCSMPDSSVYTEALEMFSAPEQHLTPGEKAFLPGALVLTPRHAELTLNKRSNLHFLGWLLFSPARANSMNSESLCENCSCGDWVFGPCLNLSILRELVLLILLLRWKGLWTACAVILFSLPGPFMSMRVCSLHVC